MLYLCCAFDEKSSKPLMACSFESETKDVNFYPIYQKGTGLTVFEAEQNLNQVKDLIGSDQIVVTDFKPFIKGFQLDGIESLNVYDVNGDRIRSKEASEVKKELLKKIQDSRKIELNSWQKILANSKIVYHHLEQIGFVLNGLHQQPQYDLTYSGRSKCLRHNIQGTKDGDEVSLPKGHDTFLHFDWVAADLRVAALISDDKDLEKTFLEADPYTEMSKELNLPRDDCKKEMLKCLYSMDLENPVIDMYPKLKEWMMKQIEKITQENYAESILGRRFYLEEHRTERSVFNATIQGSVAHAMQAVIYRVYQLYPDNLITEVHDSLIMSCNQKRMARMAADVIRIMQHPFKDILESNPKFPLKLSIGPKWREWKLYREYR